MVRTKEVAPIIEALDQTNWEGQPVSVADRDAVWAEQSMVGITHRMLAAMLVADVAMQAGKVIVPALQAVIMALQQGRHCCLNRRLRPCQMWHVCIQYSQAYIPHPVHDMS